MAKKFKDLRKAMSQEAQEQLVSTLEVKQPAVAEMEK